VQNLLVIWIFWNNLNTTANDVLLIHFIDCQKFKDLLEKIADESLAKDEGETEECPSAAGETQCEQKQR
jgi:hypothetical protein